jgi:hypothetical protein
MWKPVSCHRVSRAIACSRQMRSRPSQPLGERNLPPTEHDVCSGYGKWRALGEQSHCNRRVGATDPWPLPRCCPLVLLVSTLGQTLGQLFHSTHRAGVQRWRHDLHHLIAFSNGLLMTLPLLNSGMRNPYAAIHPIPKKTTWLVS